jgi:hypothetical protein
VVIYVVYSSCRTSLARYSTAEVVGRPTTLQTVRYYNRTIRVLPRDYEDKPKAIQSRPRTSYEHWGLFDSNERPWILAGAASVCVNKESHSSNDRLQVSRCCIATGNSQSINRKLVPLSRSFRSRVAPGKNTPSQIRPNTYQALPNMPSHCRNTTTFPWMQAPF